MSNFLKLGMMRSGILRGGVSKGHANIIIMLEEAFPRRQ